MKGWARLTSREIHNRNAELQRPTDNSSRSHRILTPAVEKLLNTTTNFFPRQLAVRSHPQVYLQTTRK